MDMDRGTLARIDRKLLAGLDDEAYRTVRVPATAAKWSTWKRYCDSAGVPMGRAVTILIDREIISVFGEITGETHPVFTQRAAEELAIRETKIVAREREVDTDEARMRESSERLRRWEDELEVREQQAELASKHASRHSTARSKIGRNKRALRIRSQVQALPRPFWSPPSRICGVEGPVRLGCRSTSGRVPLSTVVVG